MIVIFSLIAGAVFGAAIAKKREGNRLDMLQYGAVYGIVFALLGLFLTLIIEKSL